MDISSKSDRPPTEKNSRLCTDGEVLVVHGQVVRDDDDVVRVFGNGVAIVAGRREQCEGSREGVAVLPGDV